MVFFDFCETLVNFQTADGFVDFVREKSGCKRMLKIEKLQKLLIKLRFFAVCYKVFPKKSIEKRFKLFQLRGFSMDELNEYSKLFYSEKIKSNFIQEIFEKFLKHKSEGDTIVVISGGYSLYLKHFIEEFNIPHLFASEIEFKNNYCTGLIKGMDCLYDNKVTFIEGHGIEKEQNTFAYSDSITDLPLLKWVKRGIVISKNIPQKWAIQNGFEEIIWTH